MSNQILFMIITLFLILHSLFTFIVGCFELHVINTSSSFPEYDIWYQILIHGVLNVFKALIMMYMVLYAIYIIVYDDHYYFILATDTKTTIYLLLSIVINIWSTVTFFLLTDDFKKDISLRNSRLWNLYLLEVILCFIYIFSWILINLKQRLFRFGRVEANAGNLTTHYNESKIYMHA